MQGTMVFHVEYLIHTLTVRDKVKIFQDDQVKSCTVWRSLSVDYHQNACGKQIKRGTWRTRQQTHEACFRIEFIASFNLTFTQT